LAICPNEDGLTAAPVLMVSVAIQAVLAVACGLLTNFFLVVTLYLLYGVAIGLASS